MSEGISESRFKMWRAVFAMAHADGLVTDHEKSFMENYLEKVPFSPEQREILREDMRDPEDVNDMLGAVEEPEDRATFFQFARELVWCDGDLAMQEEAIKKRLSAEQMKGLNIDELERELRRSRDAGKRQRAEEDRQDRQLFGLFGSFLKKLFGG